MLTVISLILFLLFTTDTPSVRGTSLASSPKPSNAPTHGVCRGTDEDEDVMLFDEADEVGFTSEERVDGHTRGNGIFRVRLEGAQNFVGGVTGGASVPQAEPRDAVRVNVLGRALEFGEYREVVARIRCLRMGDLQQDRAVALDNQGAVGHLTNLLRLSQGRDASHGQRALDLGCPV